jgi:hypothetical protein
VLTWFLRELPLRTTADEPPGQAHESPTGADHLYRGSARRLGGTTGDSAGVS